MNQPRVLRKASASMHRILAFADGQTLPMEKAADPTFAAKILGDGLVIAPTGNVLYALVEEGAEVKAGQPLLQFDRDLILADGYSDQIIMVITNENDCTGMRFMSNLTVQGGTTTIANYH